LESIAILPFSNLNLRIDMRTLKSQDPIYVIGHLNPDTDAICAAIGYADYLQRAENMNAVALRCGTVPGRVEWVLDQAGLEAPELITDVRTTAELIADKNVRAVSEDDTFLSVYNAMQESGLEAIPVVSDEGEIRGILNFTQMMQLLMPQNVSGGNAVKEVLVSPHNVLKSLMGKSVGAPISEVEKKLTMFVGASDLKSTLSAIKEATECGTANKQIVICGDRVRLQKEAIINKVRLIIVTGGYEVCQEHQDLAKENGVMIITCDYDTAATVQLLRCSRIVKSALGNEFLCVNATDPISEIKQRLSSASQDVFPVVETGTRKFMGVFTQAELVSPPNTKLVLIDHNEYSQAVRGVEEAEVKIVVDHHRLGGNVVSREPIHFLNEPVGSSSTLVARKYRDNDDIEITKGIAMCLCAGLISDTLNLTSPTTTDTDRKLLKWLCEKAGVEADQFTNDFFASGSLMLKGSVKEIVHTDRKEFCEGGKTVSITQVEEVGLTNFDDRRVEIEAELSKLKNNKGYDLVLAAITDVSTHLSMIVAVGDSRIVRELPYEHRADGVIIAKGVVSRKKQIFPAVCDAIHSSSATVLDDA